MKYWYKLQCRCVSKTSCYVKARHKRWHTAWFYLYEISRIDKIQRDRKLTGSCQRLRGNGNGEKTALWLRCFTLERNALQIEVVVCTTLGMYQMPLNCIHFNGNFMLMNFKRRKEKKGGERGAGRTWRKKETKEMWEVLVLQKSSSKM